MCSPQPGRTTTCWTILSLARARSAVFPRVHRRDVASSVTAPALSVQQTGASGACNVGSTKRTKAPPLGFALRRSYPPQELARRKQPWFDLVGPVLPCFALVVGIAPQEFPGKLRTAERQHVVVGADRRRPVRSNGVTRIGHGATTVAPMPTRPKVFVTRNRTPPSTDDRRRGTPVRVAVLGNGLIRSFSHL